MSFADYLPSNMSFSVAEITDYLSNNIYSSAIGLALVLYLIAVIRRRNSPLSKIPTVGPTGIITSRIGILRTLKNGGQLIQEGYEKYPIFKIRTPFSWFVIVAGPQHLEDMRRANDDQMSFLAALNQMTQFDYTISPRLKADDCHIKVVRGVMTKNIGPRYDDVMDEINKSLDSILAGADKDWVDIPVYTSMGQLVSRFSTRFFVGPELSSNPKYTEIMEAYAAHVVKHGAVLSVLPNWLRPLVSRLQFDTVSKIREIEDYLRPVIEKRLERGVMGSPDADSNDMITWLWNGADKPQRTAHDIAIRMIWLNIAAIRTTSQVLTSVLFNLAAYPSYIEPLRAEISSIIDEEGWSKVSIEKMKKLDSFVKESQRHHTSFAVSRRIAVNDFTFSDGTFIPKGTSFAVAGRSLNWDERVYSNPDEFQGFRFVDMDPHKFQMTSLSLEYMGFGIGKRACPGRFFAVAELKTVIAKILMEYDIKLTDEAAGRPKDSVFAGIFVDPNKSAKVSLKKRLLVV
ncbi:hypothetical protein NP233_g4899 [Leucocoprinus birnbaumii]|uniref:Cytochrome P450 n=1 Tax=Leucocoprinus birnbaumii TaxID=56174 RepID=A0AAD5VTU0_9AGAR|nr:hypothetical protein NP233_g4899 [Leucocoprinus birnbaumii]